MWDGTGHALAFPGVWAWVSDPPCLPSSCSQLIPSVPQEGQGHGVVARMVAALLSLLPSRHATRLPGLELAQ